MTVREEIAELVHRYCDAVVRRDADQWIGTWAHDARWVLSADRTVEGRDAILALWLKSMSALASVVQMAHNGEVRADGDHATGRWYVTEHLCRSNGERGILLAYYDDAYIRTADGWRFQSRELVRQYHGAPDLSAPFLNAV